VDLEAYLFSRGLVPTNAHLVSVSFADEKPTCRSLSAKAETLLPASMVCGFREFRTRRRSKRDEPERLGLPQRLVGLLNGLMDLTRCCLVPTG
jgi:hypothetical protein